MPMAVNRQHAIELPASLREHLADSWEAFTEASSEAQYPIPRNPDFTASMMRVWACSDFATRTCIQNPALLYGLLGNGDLLADYASGEYQRKLAKALSGSSNGDGLSEQLRVFRRQEMLRIAWRDLAGWASLDEVLHDLSALADASISKPFAPLSAVSGFISQFLSMCSRMVRFVLLSSTIRTGTSFSDTLESFGGSRSSEPLPNREVK